jgi:hypothetical protein
MPDHWAAHVKTITYEATQEQIDAAAANPMGMMAASIAEALAPDGPIAKLWREAIDRQWERVLEAAFPKSI